MRKFRTPPVTVMLRFTRVPRPGQTDAFRWLRLRFRMEAGGGQVDSADGRQYYLLMAITNGPTNKLEKVTVRMLTDLATQWKVSKTEALKRAMSEAGMPQPPVERLNAPAKRQASRA